MAHCARAAYDAAFTHLFNEDVLASLSDYPEAVHAEIGRYLAADFPSGHSTTGGW
ncbi:hypothetical protein SBA4_1190006 [Candidatus Sulfopaludibacter sp. SbA4]|nr:hypothetical protein SBA4_1190006 [Candidatus Sulfopaludibacter sp. SbA4]